MNNKNEKYIECSLDEFVKYMKRTIKKKNYRKKDIFYLADIPMNYGYKLLLGEKRTRQRDIVLRICFVSHFSVSEVQEALRLYEMPILYKKFLRDKIIIDSFKKEKREIELINDNLVKHNLQPLKSCGNS